MVNPNWRQYVAEEEQQKPALWQSALSRTFDVLQRGQYASASLAQSLLGQTDLNPWQAIWAGFSGVNKAYYADVLEEAGMPGGWQRSFLGFVGDVALDPTTYLTLGAGGVGKTALKSGLKVVLTKTGRKLVQEGGEEALERAMLTGAEGLVEKGGLKFAGQTLIPQSSLDVVSNAVRNTLRKAPGFAQLEDTLGGAFVKDFTKFRKAGVDASYGLSPGELAAWKKGLDKFQRVPRVIAQEEFERAGKLFRGTTSAQKEDIFRTIWDGLPPEKGLADEPTMKIHQYYQGTLVPERSALNVELGIIEMTGPYIDAVFPDLSKLPMTIRRYFRPSAAYERRALRGKTFEEIKNVAGLSLDPEYAIAYGMASRRIALEAQNFITDTLKTFGTPHVAEEAIPEGYKFYRPGFTVKEFVDQRAVAKATREARNTVTINKQGVELLRRIARGEHIPGGSYKTLEKVGLAEDAKRVLGLERELQAQGLKLLQEQVRSVRVRTPDVRYIQDVLDKLADFRPLMGLDMPKVMEHFDQISLRTIGVPRLGTRVKNILERAEAVPKQEARKLVDKALEGFSTAQEALKSLPEKMGRPEFVMPTPIADALTAFVSPKETIKLLSVFDTVQNLWKGTVTAIFPEFHTRNMLGGVYNNWLGGIHSIRPYIETTALQMRNKVPNNPVLADLAQKITERTGMDVEDFVRHLKLEGAWGWGPIYGEIRIPREGILGKMATPLEMGRSVGEAIEINQKVAHVLGQMDNGLSLADAIESAKKFIFDYGDLSDFEKNVMRRVVPFYTWTRKNVPLQIEMLIKKPGKQVLPAKFAHAIEDKDLTDEDRALLPYWIQEQLNIVLGKGDDGKLQVLSGIGIPLEDINKLWRGTPQRTIERLISEGTPLKALGELLVDKSFFTGKPITDPGLNNYYRRVSDLVANIPGLRDWLEVKETTFTDREGKQQTAYSADPTKNFIMLSVIGRLITTSGRLATKDPFVATGAAIIPGKQYVVDLARSLVPYTTKMDEAQMQANEAYEQLAIAFSNEQISGTQFRDTREQILTQQALITQSERERQLQDIVDPQAKELIRRQYLPPGEQAEAEYYSITPDAFKDPTTGVTDWESFYQAREDYLDGLSSSQRKAFDEQVEERIQRLPLEAQKWEREYRNAQKLLQPYWDATRDLYGRMPKLKALDERLQEMENSHDMATRVLAANIRQNHKGLARIRKLSSDTRRRLRVQNKMVDRYLTIFYGYQPILATLR